MNVDALTFLLALLPDLDDYVPSDARPGWVLVSVLGVLELCVILVAAVRYFAPDWRTNTYESLTGVFLSQVTTIMLMLSGISVVCSQVSRHPQVSFC